MKIHILGICGTFMGSLAALAVKAGMQVTGQDQNVYPPMSTQLSSIGVGLIDGYDVTDIPDDIDLLIVGNVMKRGMPIIEYILNSKLPFSSGPEFLSRHILKKQHVLVVAGTHGKTTTTSMLTWILEYAGLHPGYMIGGVANNFSQSADLGAGKYFVIEGDEYDCAFFDKRSKFLHYKPQTLIVNNLEYDHADIFDDLKAITTQFNHLLRILPSEGHLVYPDNDQNVQRLLEMGCWTNKQAFNLSKVEVPKNIVGRHNVANAKAAIVAAANVGVNANVATMALAEFKGVQRRMELKGESNAIKVYSDFAHHPTAIRTTIDSLSGQRVIAIVDLCSNTMRAGIHKEALFSATEQAAETFFYSKENLGWTKDLPNIFYDKDALAKQLLAKLQKGDVVLLMSNGAFASFCEQILHLIHKSTLTIDI